MRYPILAACLILIPGEVSARCAPFDLSEALATVPHVVLGEVLRSNSDDLARRSCTPEPCRHRFEIRVTEVLKGTVGPGMLTVDYEFVRQRPTVDLFSEGQSFVFAISEVTPEGAATLLGTSCGRSGVGVERVEEVREALR